MTILVLGGTTEANALVRALIKHNQPFILSLAGVTRAPTIPDAPVRIGGFGGAQGLHQWIESNGISLIIDATHPFAATMSTHAVAAAELSKIPVLRIERPQWCPTRDDHWEMVETPAQAAAALGDFPLRVWLTIGRKDLTAFSKNTIAHTYFVRSVDPVAPEHLPPGAQQILGRGPFSLPEEAEFVARHAINCLVTKNSGGTATFPKLIAARACAMRVIMIKRPALPACESVSNWADALAWIQHYHTGAMRRGV